MTCPYLRIADARLEAFEIGILTDLRRFFDRARTLLDRKRCYAATEWAAVASYAQGRSSSILVMRWPATIFPSTSDR
jgi:hypothetical protein